MSTVRGGPSVINTDLREGLIVWTTVIWPKRGEPDEACTPIVCGKDSSHKWFFALTVPKKMSEILVQSCMCTDAVARWLPTCGAQK